MDLSVIGLTLKPNIGVLTQIAIFLLHLVGVDLAVVVAV